MVANSTLRSIAGALVGLLLGGILSATTSNAAEDNQVAIDDGRYDWSGPYSGVHVGYADLDPNSASPFRIQPDSEGFIGGGHLGYNFQVYENIVIGIEADISKTALEENQSCFNPAFNCTAGSDWMATVRGRLGFAWDRMLIFGTGGIAFMDYYGQSRVIPAGAVFPDNDILTGWTVGAGAEYAFNDIIRIGVEFLYANFESANLAYDILYPVNPEVYTVRARLSIDIDRLFHGR